MAGPDSNSTDWGVIGHGGAVRLLSGSMNADRLAHAYLMTGAEQVGRKTLALALARAVNCEAESQGPCGSCRQCDRILRGIHADVRVIDRHTPIRGTVGGKASDEGEDKRRARFSIEHIREMQRDAALNAFEGRRHVFILDGAETLRFQDGLVTEAANALLKTLEEPPGDVLLVLIAPSRSAVPETVASRCQIIDLRPVATDEIASGLVILRGTSLEDAERVARLAEGKPGRAIDLVEDPAAQGRHSQTVMRVLETTAGGLEARFRYARDLSGAYRKDKAAVEAELDVWTSLWRDVLLARHGVAQGISHTDWMDTIEAIANQLAPDAIADVISATRRTSEALISNAAPQLAFEVMMLALPTMEPGSMPLQPAGEAPVSGVSGDPAVESPAV